MVPDVIFLYCVYYTIFDLYKKKTQSSGPVLLMCLSVQMCVCGGDSQGITQGRIYPREKQKALQKYVRVPSYLCSGSREATECWEGSANFRECLIFYLHLNPVVVSGPRQRNTQQKHKKHWANQSRHQEQAAVNMRHLFDVWGFLLPNKLIYVSTLNVYENFP